jgi:acetyl esterase/lipase
MASSADSNGEKVIVHNLLPHLLVYSDGTIDRLRNFPIVPPQQEDPETGVSSKDIVFSNDPYLTARLYLPKLTQTNDQNQKLPILVYFHGGAFTFESAFSSIHHIYCNLIASQANVVIATIEHRKAPEYYLPTAYNDCWAGLCWVASHATQNPINSDPWITNHGDFNRVFIGGDSSGGNLVHNVAMRAGVEALPGGVKLLGAYLNHPYFWGATPIGKEPVIGFEETLQSRIWKFAYPSAPGGLDNPMLNPLASGAPSLATLGCSRLLITAAGKDHLLFRDRVERYYEAVKESGWKGKVEFFEEKDEDHVYHMYDFDSEQSKRLIKVVTDFLSR